MGYPAVSIGPRWARLIPSRAMAMTQCKECSTQISTEAESCPQCGAKVKKTSVAAKGCLGVILLFVGISALGAMFGDGDASSAPIGNAPSSFIPPAPTAPTMQCPAGYSVSGTRGCFTVDSITKSVGKFYQVRGKLVSKESCDTLVVTLSAEDAGGSVICSGNGMVADISAGQAEPWEGSVMGCEQKPSSVSLKLATCL